MATLARLFGRVVRSLAGLVVVVVVALVVVYGLLRGGFLTSSLDRIITLLARKDGVFFVTVEDVSGDVPGHLRVKKVEVGDYYGVWITVEDAEATWHPFDIFHLLDHEKWRVNIDDIHAARVAWTRLPKDGPDEIKTPFHWDKFIRLVVGHLVIDDFDLSGSIVAGGHARVRAEGSGVLGEWDHGFVKLDLAHIDERTGKASIDLKTQGSPLELLGTITAEEGPGGALASLAHLTDAGSVKLDVRASGPMRDWHGEADVTATNVGVLHAQTKLSYTPDGPFEVTGSFDPVPAQRQKYLVGEGAPIAIFAKGAWAPDVEVRLDRVKLTADGRELSADGRLDLATHEFHVAGRLSHEREGDPVSLTLLDVTSGKLDGHGVLGDGGNLEAVLDLVSPSAGGVTAGALRATLKATDAPGDSVPTFELSADASGLSREDMPLPVVGESARLTADGRMDLPAGVVTSERVRLEGGALVVEGPLSFGDSWRTMKASLKANAADLESLARSFGTTVKGSATAQIEIDARSEWRDVDATVSASSAGVAIGEPGWNALVGGASSLEASFHGAPRGPAHGDLLLKAAGIEAAAKGDVEAGGKAFVADGRFKLDNLARLAEPARAAISGRLEATATARGDLDRFGMNVALRGERFAWNDVRLDTLTSDVEVEGLPDAWSAKVRSTAKTGNQAASLDGVVSMPEAHRAVVRGLVLRGPQTDGSADLDIDLAAATAAGTLQLKSEDLSRWRPMTGFDLGGSIDLTVTLARSSSIGAATQGRSPAGAAASQARSPAGAATIQKISGTATARKLRIPIEDGELFVDALEASADGLVVGPRPAGSGHVHVARLRFGSTNLVDGVVNVSGDGRLWNFDTTVDARDVGERKLGAAGTLLPGPPMELALSRASGVVDGVAIALVDSMHLRMEARDSSSWTLGQAAFLVGDGGRLSGQASSSGGKMRIDAEATTVPLSVASLVAPSLQLEGTIDGALQLEGASVATATGVVSVRGHKVASAGLEDQGVAPVDLQADAKVGKGRISGTASLVGLHETNFLLSLDAPLGTASTASPFVAKLTWKGAMAEVLALVPLGGDSLAGQIDADLQVKGTMAAPRVTGRAVIDGGTWEHASTGLVLRGLHAEFIGSGDSLELSSLTATDGETGTVRARGRAHFETLPGFDVELDLDATDAMLARLDVITARADAKLALRASRSAEAGAGVGGSISGSVRVGDARIEIPQRFVADVPEIDVIEVGAAIDAAVAEAKVFPRAALDLDIAVVADNRVFVTGRGLESEWSSDIHVRGNTADPRIEGKFSSVRGQLSLLGRRFDVNSATLRFDGERGNEPYLTMTARAEANDITAIADVTGPARHPAIELRSEPALPRDEVLSRVLFGQSAANLTPIQSVQLARSLAELTGTPILGGGDFLSGIGRTLGFDRLGIDSAGSSGGAALTASKYLTDSVYLRVQQGLTPEASKLSLEWKIFKHITIESDVSQDAQGEVGATWRWDY